MLEMLFGTIPPIEDMLAYIQAGGGITASVFGDAAATTMALPLTLVEFALIIYVLISRNKLLMIIISFFALLMVIIGKWTIFRKAGRSGMLSLIPVVSGYMEYAVAWKGGAYWMRCLFELLVPVAPVGMIIRYIETGMSKALAPAFGIVMGLMCVCIVFWYGVVQNYKLSKVFGHSIFFALGLMIFRPLFLIILGLGSSQYQPGAKADNKDQTNDFDAWECVGCGTMNASGAQMCAGCGFGRMKKR